MGINRTLLCIHRDPVQLGLLEEKGYQLISATNAPDGLRLFMSRPVDAVAGAPKSSSPSTLSIRPQGNNPAEPETTKQLPGTPCFVYQGGLDFTGVNGTYVVNYNGYAACRGQQIPAHPRLTLCVQVSGRVNGKNAWFTINGSCMSAASATSDTVVLSTARTAFIGHGYRLLRSVAR